MTIWGGNAVVHLKFLRLVIRLLLIRERARVELHRRIAMLESAAQEAVSSGTVTVDDKDAEYWRQGDLSLNDTLHFLERHALRADRGIVKCLDEWWQFAIATSRDGRVGRDVYFQIFSSIYKALMVGYDDEDAARAIAEDWETDSCGQPYLSYRVFCNSLWELTDLWTSTVAAEEYTEFLGDLLDQVCPMTTDEQGRTKRVLLAPSEVQFNNSLLSNAIALRMRHAGTKIASMLRLKDSGATGQRRLDGHGAGGSIRQSKRDPRFPIGKADSNGSGSGSQHNKALFDIYFDEDKGLAALDPPSLKTERSERAVQMLRAQQHIIGAVRLQAKVRAHRQQLWAKARRLAISFVQAKIRKMRIRRNQAHRNNRQLAIAMAQPFARDLVQQSQVRDLVQQSQVRNPVQQSQMPDHEDQGPRLARQPMADSDLWWDRLHGSNIRVHTTTLAKHLPAPPITPSWPLTYMPATKFPTAPHPPLPKITPSRPPMIPASTMLSPLKPPVRSPLPARPALQGPHRATKSLPEVHVPRNVSKRMAQQSGDPAVRRLGVSASAPVLREAGASPGVMLHDWSAGTELGVPPRRRKAARGGNTGKRELVLRPQGGALAASTQYPIPVSGAARAHPQAHTIAQVLAASTQYPMPLSGATHPHPQAHAIAQAHERFHAATATPIELGSRPKRRIGWAPETAVALGPETMPQHAQLPALQSPGPYEESHVASMRTTSIRSRQGRLLVQVCAQDV